MSGIVLSARLDSAAAAALARDLEARLEQDIELDAGEVTHLGALALQTLVVDAAHWRTAGRTFSVGNIPSPVLEQINDLGVADPDMIAGAAA